MANTKIQSEQIVDDVALGGNPTTTTQSAGNDTTRVATTAFVTTAVSNLVDSAPSSLNTLNELAAAMNDNASFFSTVLPLSGGTMTGGLVLGGTTPTLTIGDAGAEDTKIVFDGNAQDYYIGLDDSADDLVIGLGSTVGTTPIISIDENSDVAIPNGAIAVGQATFSGSSVLADFHGSGNGVGAQLAFANDHNTDKFYVGIEGNTTGDAFLYQQEDADINFYTNNAFAAKIDSAGRLLIGSTAALSVTGGARQFQIEGTTGVAAAMSIIRHSNSAGGATISLSKSRATADGGVTVVANNDVLGELRFTGADGSDHDAVAANIKAEIDGTPGSNDMPGRLSFWTTSDGSAAETERMVISSAGMVTITPDSGATTGTLRLHNGNGNGTLGALEFGHSGNVDHGSIQYTGNMDFFTGDSDDSRFYISSAGLVGINTANPEHHLHVTEPGDTREDGIVKIGGSTTGLGLELSYNQSGHTVTEIVANPTYTNTQSLMRLCVDRDANANQLTLLGGGFNGMGTDTPRSRLDVVVDHAVGYVITAQNDGNNVNRYGIKIIAGSDDSSGTSYLLDFFDGDGTNVGSVTNAGGAVSYGAFTAHHPCVIPDEDNDEESTEPAYPYGTLLETTSLSYSKNSDDSDTERGIIYNVQKSSGAYSRKVLGAYGNSMNQGPEEETNKHQALILGDGHILCNNEKGNISVGDGICTSSTAGIGMKADKMAMIIGIAQEDVTFSGSETKLVAVQYGLQQFTPWTD